MAKLTTKNREFLKKIAEAKAEQVRIAKASETCDAFKAGGEYQQLKIEFKNAILKNKESDFVNKLFNTENFLNEEKNIKKLFNDIGFDSKDLIQNCPNMKDFAESIIGTDEDIKLQTYNFITKECKEKLSLVNEDNASYFAGNTNFGTIYCSGEND